MATDTQETIEELFETVFSMWSVPKLYEDQWDQVLSHGKSCMTPSHKTVKYGLSPVGLRTKNDCAGEGQQQFIQSTTKYRVVSQRLAVSHESALAVGG
jgi:hypothetical protein